MAATSAASGSEELLVIDPGELRFEFELDRLLTSTLLLRNQTKSYVAFKVKTTAPKKFCVNPSSGVLQPRSTFELTVTMRAQHHRPQEAVLKDKFLVQSVVAPDEFVASDINQEMFTSESGNKIFEKKLRVTFVLPDKPTISEEAFNNNAVVLKDKIQEVKAALTTVLEERNAAVALSQRLQQELSTLTANTRRSEASSGYSLLLVLLVGILGIIVGYLTL